jgi:hypothetical protein
MKSPTTDFFTDIDYPSIIDSIKGIFTSDASLSTLLDFERVLDEADMYAYQNWDLGELVDGPKIKKYTVACIFMYPCKLMPDPRAGKRIIKLGCTVHFKKTKIKVPIKVDSPDDYKAGTHYPKMIEREVWLVRIEIPKQLMNDIREGSIDLAGQNIELDELDDAYEKDYDKEGQDDEGDMSQQTLGGQGVPPPMPGAGAAPGGQPLGM